MFVVIGVTTFGETSKKALSGSGSVWEQDILTCVIFQTFRAFLLCHSLSFKIKFGSHSSFNKVAAYFSLM